MFKRFIVVTEWSANSFALIDRIERLKVLGAQECLLLQNFMIQVEDPNGLDIAAIYAAAENSLSMQKTLLEKQGFKVEARIIEGSSKCEISEIAKNGHYELIVVGDRKHSMLGEVLFGGIAYDVMHQAQTPVLVIRLDEDQSEEKEPVSLGLNAHVLFATDFSDNASQAFDYVKELVATGVKKVTLMHVQDQYKIEPYLVDRLEEFNKIDEERLQHMKEFLLDSSDAQVDVVIKYGNPSAEILHFIHENNVQLVVMGSQGKGFMKDLFLGGVSHNIARQAESSVLLIPVRR